MSRSRKLNLPVNHDIPLDSFKERNNRRIKGDRLETCFPVYASTTQGKLIQGYVQTINLSWSGVLVESNIPFRVGDTLNLEFTLPETDYCISAKAKAVRIASEEFDFDEQSNQVALIFKELDVNLRRMLNAYILERLDI